jgi:hypothetical protein
MFGISYTVGFSDLASTSTICVFVASRSEPLTGKTHEVQDTTVASLDFFGTATGGIGGAGG